MFKTRKDTIREPFRYYTGERVYELIGKSQSTGSAINHTFSQATIPVSCSSRFHYHLKAEETFYIIKGTARMIVDEREFDVEPGDAVLIMPQEKHQILNNGETDLEFIVVCAPGWSQNDSVFLD